MKNDKNSKDVQNSLQQELDIPNAKPGSSWGTVFVAAASVKLEEVDEEFLQRTQCSATPLAELASIAAAASSRKRNCEVMNTKTNGGCTKSIKLSRGGEEDGIEKGKEIVLGRDDIDHRVDVSVMPKKSRKNQKTKSNKAQRKVIDKQLSTEVVTDQVVLDKSSLETDCAARPPKLQGQMVPDPNNPKEHIMVLLDYREKVVYSTTVRTPDDGMVAIGKIRSSGKIKWYSNAIQAGGQELVDDDVGGVHNFPYPVDPDDHCESPLAAFQDIAPILELVSPKSYQCKIYDPYYCDGAVKRNLASLGFPLVHNVKQDCYEVWSTGELPLFDVLVTNPPYSQDHIPKLIDFLSAPFMSGKPWFLLMPQWVSKKPYFADKWDKKAFFLVPTKRYVYIPPKNFRDKRESDVHKKSSPFVTIWFIWGGTPERNSRMYDRCMQLRSELQFELARSKNGLRDLRRKKA